MPVPTKRKILISRYNTKLGYIPNISLSVIKSCKPGVLCQKGCYAKISYLRFPGVKKAWDNNLNTYLENPRDYFGQIRNFLKKSNPRYFRWHTGGDFPDQRYLNSVIRIARDFPDIKFLAFTKRTDFYFHRIPNNFALIFSGWPGMELPSNVIKRFRIAWMQDGTETRIPKNAIKCSGACENCMSCWDKSLTQDVFFHKH